MTEHVNPKNGMLEIPFPEQKQPVVEEVKKEEPVDEYAHLYDKNDEASENLKRHGIFD